MSAELFDTIDEAVNYALDHAFDGDMGIDGALWTVQELPDNTTLIIVNLFEPKGKQIALYQISEIEGPVACGCPLRLLKKYKDHENKWWRQSVRRCHRGLETSWIDSPKQTRKALGRKR